MNETTDTNSENEEASNPGDKYLELGQGVQRSAPPPEEKVEEAPPAPPVDDKNADEWCDTPTYSDQFVKYPTTTRMRGPMFSVFDLEVPSSASALNALMDRQYPDTAPRAMICDITKQFCEPTCNWKILVTYNVIQYRKLLSKPIDP